MTRRARIVLLLAALAGMAALLLWGFAGIPGFGNYHHTYGILLNHVATPERHTTNVVASVVFDYRGVDTMGEEFILFAAVLGVVLLLRSQGGKEEEEKETSEQTEQEVGSDAVKVIGAFAVGAVLLVGLWLVAFGYVTPGGGFQGGVAIAAATLLLFLACSHSAFAPFGNETRLDPLEATGAGGYVVIGLAALVSGLPFLRNLLGPGSVGTLVSGGSIPFLNWATAIEVSAALVVLFAEFLDQYIVPLSRKQESA